MIRRSVSAALAVLVLFAAAAPLASEETPEKAAEAAALSWLGLVDQGKYSESWDAAAEVFRGSVTKAQWESALGEARKPLGHLVSRNLKSAKFRKETGAHAGEYVVLEFDTSFEHRPSSIETVTPMKQKDGTWKVAGYFIK
ncbi:MAG TPA: DUF4019 domain-containing protein [Thermoanaerobaculia bacterium]|nr:DUF4019 domain-containing protein [Thermoanaerobaculia bacterium]